MNWNEKDLASILERRGVPAPLKRVETADRPFGLPVTHECSSCGSGKPTGEFYTFKRKIAGGEHKTCRHRHCKTCHSVKVANWKAKNPETTRAIDKRARFARSDKRAAYMREYRKTYLVPETTEQQREKRRDTAKRNPERVLAYRQRWIDKPANRQRYNAWQANRRARVREAEGSFTASEWLEICDRYDNRCLCCGDAGQVTIDHVQPLSMGGPNYASNLQPLCAKCNSAKGASWIDYRAGVLV